MQRWMWTAAFVIFLGAQSQAWAQNAANLPLAEQAFVRGVELANAERWEDALEQFNESLRLYPTQSALFNRALCLGLLARPAEAVRDLEEHMRLYGATVDEQRRREVVEELSSLRQRVGRIEVHVDGAASASVSMDGVVVGTAPLTAPLVVNPGRHQITVSPPDVSPVSRWVTVGAGDELSLVIAVGGTVAALGTIEVEVDVADAAVRIDGALVGRSPLPEPIAATEGTHVILVEAEGYEPARAQVDVVAGQVARVELSVTEGTSTTTAPTDPPETNDRRGMFIGAIVATGVGVAILATAMGLGIWNHSEYGEWDSDHTRFSNALSAQNPPENIDTATFATDLTNHNGWASTIRNVDIATYVLYGVGGAAVAAGITLFVLRPILNRDPSISLLPTPGGLVLAGNW